LAIEEMSSTVTRMYAPVPRPLWWLPTFGLFLFAAIMGAGIFSGPGRIFEDPAVGRHLRTGEIILATHHVPRTDPLSFTYAGKPWVDYEWAFEATLGELNRAGGLALVAAFCTAIFAATMLGVYRTLVQSGVSLVAGVLVTGIVFLTLHLHYSVRPLLFTYLFFALVVEVWFRRVQPLRRDWILLPLVFVAWANLHAGWAAALAFLALAISGRAIDRITRRVTGEEAPLIPWIGLTLVCALAVSLNPWGWSLYRQIFAYATSYKSFALWNEYLPPDFSQPSMSAITVLFIVGLVVLTRLTRRAPLWRWETVVPVLFFLDEGLKAQRHVLLLMEAAAVPVARDLQALLEGRSLPFLRDRLRQFAERQRLARGDAWLAFVVAVVLTLFFLPSQSARQIEVGKSVTPRLVAFMRQHPDRFTRPLVTTWNAGPLLWDLRPDFRVSFDDRGDFYGDKTVFSFVHLYNAVPGWRDTLAQGRYDSAVLDPNLQLNQMLPLTPGWHQVYRDEHAVVYWHDAVAAPK
jgi:hypothetical protein